MMSDEWPRWATQQVEISEWDARWQQRAADLIIGLEPLLSPWLDGRIEHIGSTAVPGLAAKPVIDLLAPVASLVDSEPAGSVLAEEGWHLVPPELDQRPWRRLHVLADGDRRVSHLQVVESHHPRRRETIAFRDHLRARPGLAAEYEALKRLAAEEHADDREAYTDAKAAFIRSVVLPQA